MEKKVGYIGTRSLGLAAAMLALEKESKTTSKAFDDFGEMLLEYRISDRKYSPGYTYKHNNRPPKVTDLKKRKSKRKIAKKSRKNNR